MRDKRIEKATRGRNGRFSVLHFYFVSEAYLVPLSRMSVIYCWVRDQDSGLKL